MSVSSFLQSRLFSMCVTLEGSLGNSWTVLFSFSSGWMDSLEVFASGITGSAVDSAIAFLRFCSSTEASKASAVSQLSQSQSYGDASIGTRPLQDQISIIMDHHELGQSRPSEECVVCHFKID
jgi:hypothetical protein